MIIQKQDHPGHFCDSENCSFFLHIDIVPDGATDNKDTTYCVSAVGEYRPNPRHLNASGLTYEIMVFDRKSDPWSEIEGYRTDDKDDCVAKVYELAKKYQEVAG